MTSSPTDLFRMAQAAGRAGQPGQAALFAGQAAAGFLASGDADRALTSRIFQARMRQASGDPADAEAILRAAAELAQRKGLDGRRLDALTDLGAILEAAGRLGEAMAVHREVLAARESGLDPIARAIACANVARLEPRMALPAHRDAAHAEARALLGRAGRLFAANGRPAMAGQVLVVLGDLERACGRLDAARAALVDAHAVAERTGDAGLLATAALNLGHVERDLGDAAAARQLFLAAGRASRGAADRLGEARAALAVAAVDADTIAPADAVVRFAEVEAAFRSIGQAPGALPATAGRAIALARAGKLGAAAAVLAKVRDALRAAGERLGAAEAGIALAEVALARRDHAASTRELAAARAASLPDRLSARIALVDARAALNAVDPGAARAALADAVRGEPTRASRFAADLIAAQLDGWATAAGGLDRLHALAQAASNAPREAAAVQSARAAALAWAGRATAAISFARDAMAAWAERAEPVGVACAWVTAVVVGDAGAPEPFSDAAIAEHADVADQVAAARAIRLLDDRTWREALDRLDARGDKAACLWLAGVGARHGPAFAAPERRAWAAGRGVAAWPEWHAGDGPPGGGG